jgi:hypothetical protein
VNKTLLAAVAGAILVVVIIVLVVLLPQKDICSDDVRGYEHTASSSLDATRENLSKIKASIAVEERHKVPTQLDKLTATNFAALKACDTQCKLLGQCLRFVFIKAPSQACPMEYKDYKARTDSALLLLGELQRIEMAAKQATQKAETLSQTKEDAKELERTSGSTGGRVAVLQARAQQLEQDVLQDLSVIGQQMNLLIPQQIGEAE